MVLFTRYLGKHCKHCSTCYMTTDHGLLYFVAWSYYIFVISNLCLFLLRQEWHPTRVLINTYKKHLFFPTTNPRIPTWSVFLKTFHSWSITWKLRFEPWLIYYSISLSVFIGTFSYIHIYVHCHIIVGLHMKVQYLLLILACMNTVCACMCVNTFVWGWLPWKLL